MLESVRTESNDESVLSNPELKDLTESLQNMDFSPEMMIFGSNRALCQVVGL